MIVITDLSTKERTVLPGDKFNLTITDKLGCNVVISETITTKKIINFIASFRFALDDGSCPGFHLTGIFANKDELPSEIKNAVLFEDLTKKQQKNFVKTVGIKIPKKKSKKQRKKRGLM